MSKSPTHNPSPPPNITNSPESTTSRTKIIEEHTTELPTASGHREPPPVVRLSSPPPRDTPKPSGSKRPSHLIQSAEDSPEPMAKRIRRVSPEARRRPESHSSPSDSQDEMDIGNLDDRPEHLLPTSAPPKKKRTRTLTTPHQSAVLHALLAQSRFPTTAMREEVGRSIGLSARKVQIWFQNQRQKARRPRSQSATTSARPPQYGPFPSTSESVSRNVQGFEVHGREGMPYSRRLSPEVQTSVEVSARLLGPGMPGAPLYSHQQSYRQVPAPPAPVPVGEHRFSVGDVFHRISNPEPYYPPRVYPIPRTRPATSQPISWRERDPSRTLPPLVSSRPSSSTYGARRTHLTGAHPYVPSWTPSIPPRSTSPESRFAHHPPEPPLRASMNLPPPFTMQPAPQWDESSYTIFPRPSSSAWSPHGSHSTRGRSSSPLTFRREHMAIIGERSDTYYLAEHTPIPHSSSPRSIPPTSTPPLRSGRYDPVRAIFVPFSTPSISPARSPERTSGGGEGDERADRGSPRDEH